MLSASSLADVFVYGSLLRGLHNHHLLEASLFRRPAVTRHAAFRLVDSGHGYPFALESLPGKPGTAIKGELWTVTEPVLAELDKLEGHPDFYRRRQVELDLEESAWMYILHDKVEIMWMEEHAQDYVDVRPAGDWRLYHAPETAKLFGGSSENAAAVAAAAAAADAAADAAAAAAAAAAPAAAAAAAAAATADGTVTSLDAVASLTVNQLVEVMGYPLDKATAAVEAIEDKSDTSLAVEWLITHGAEDYGGAVEFVHCPHLDDPAVPLIEAALLVPATHAEGARCAHGCVSNEQWVCLQCGGVHCGRYVQRHALEHHRSDPMHMSAASLADLSVHCYRCDACAWGAPPQHRSAAAPQRRSAAAPQRRRCPLRDPEHARQPVGWGSAAAPPRALPGACPLRLILGVWLPDRISARTLSQTSSTHASSRCSGGCERSSLGRTVAWIELDERQQGATE